jgi:hypothetical protein
MFHEHAEIHAEKYDDSRNDDPPVGKNHFCNVDKAGNIHTLNIGMLKQNFTS